MLVSQGAAVHGRDDYDLTASSCDFSTQQLKRCAEADATCSGGGTGTLYSLCPVVRKVLIEFGTNVNHQDDGNRTLLQLSAAKVLLRYGIDVNAICDWGVTPVLNKHELCGSERNVCN